MAKIELIQGDITTITADAIVNAANKTLLGGGGVDGAIHKAAGKELLEECKTIGGCQTGDAKITKAYNLPAKYVIHTVGPVWNCGNSSEDKLLMSCYKKSLELALEYNLKSIAFPNISTGIYKFPKQRAAIIAVHQIHEFIRNNNKPEKIIFVCFDNENYELYRKLLR